MSTLCNRMEVLVGEIRSSTEARRASLEHIRSQTYEGLDRFRRHRQHLRSQTHEDLDRFRRHRLETVQESLENLRQRLEVIRETAGSLRQATRAVLGEIACDVSAAQRLWSGGEVREFAGPATTVMEPALPPEPGAGAAAEALAQPVAEAVEPALPEPEEKPAAEREQILRVLRTHPEGIRLVDIGNELGVDWRGLIAVTKSLLDEGKIEKIDHLYYPAEETNA